jgi:hypothetical protein
MSTGQGVKLAPELPREGPKQVILQRVEIDRPRIFVNPPVIHIGNGKSRRKTVEWVNETGADVSLWFPNGEQVFDRRGESEKGFANPFAIGSKKRLILYVKADCEDGRYRYAVYCPSLMEYAQGNSAPEVDCP